MLYSLFVLSLLVTVEGAGQKAWLRALEPLERVPLSFEVGILS